MRPAPIIAACVLVAVGGGLMSCGLFEPRKPNPPPPVASGCRNLTDSLAIFQNIEDPSIGYGRLAGLTCYSSMLDTSFAFHPDPQDSSQALPLTPYIGWDENVESRVNSGIAGDQQYINVKFGADYASTIFPDPATEIHFRNYQVLFSAKNSPDTLRFSGLADMTLHRGTDGQWRITDWVDHRGGAGDPTWGILRAKYRTGF